MAQVPIERMVCEPWWTEAAYACAFAGMTPDEKARWHREKLWLPPSRRPKQIPRERDQRS